MSSEGPAGLSRERMSRTTPIAEAVRLRGEIERLAEQRDALLEAARHAWRELLDRAQEADTHEMRFYFKQVAGVLHEAIARVEVGDE